VRLPLLEQLPYRRGAVVELQSLGGILPPERLSILYLATSWLGLVIFYASGPVNHENFFQRNPELLPEFIETVRVVA
jgi:hypothetical protein